MKSPPRIPKPSTAVAQTKLAVASNKFTQDELNITNKVKQNGDHHRLKELEQMFSKIVPASQVGHAVQRKQSAPVQFNNFIQQQLSPNLKKQATQLGQDGFFPKRQNFTPMPQSLKLSQAPDFPFELYDSKQSFQCSQVRFNRESIFQRSSIPDLSVVYRTPMPGNQYSIMYKGISENTLPEGDITLQDNLALNSVMTAEQRGARLIQMINHQYQVFLKNGIQRKKKIELPGAEIKIKGEIMHIRTPIFFQGNPGTIIQVESSIVVDVDSSGLFENKEENKEQQRDSENIQFSRMSKNKTEVSIAVTEFELRPLVQFSECTIKFNREIGLFQNLINHDYSNFGVGQVCDIAFSLDTNSLFNSHRSKMSTAASFSPLKKTGSSQITIISCTMEGFYHFIKGGEDAEVMIELSALRGSRSSALELSNPRSVKILRTIIQKSTGSALSIKASHRDKQVLGVGSISQQHYLSHNILSQQMLRREILIDGAIIMGNMGHGVSIQGEQLQEFQCEKIKKGQDIGANLSKQQVKESNHAKLSPLFTKIQVRKTRVYHCKKDGIMLKNISLSQEGKIILDSNQLQNNKGNNIWMQKVIRKDVSIAKNRKDSSLSSSSSFKNRISSFILHSRIYDAELGFGVYVNNANCQVQDSQILGNTAGGIYISCPPLFNLQQEKSSNRPYCRVIQSTIKSNKENGILSVDFFGRLDIARCEISDNIKNGIMSSQKLQSFISNCSNNNNFDSRSQIPPTQYQSSNSLLSIKANNRSNDALQAHQQLINCSSLNARDTRKLVKLSKAEIYIDICDISYNAKNGVSMNNVRLNVRQSRIQNNGNYAIAFSQSNKLLLKILDTKCFTGHQLQQKKLIDGKIGGEWGSYPNAFKTKQQFESHEDEEESKFYYNNKIINQMSSGQSQNVLDDKGVRKSGAPESQSRRNKIQPVVDGKRQKSGCCFPASNKTVEKKSPVPIKGSDKALCTTQERLQ